MAGGERLAIVAGGGPLPLRVALSARASGRDVFIVALEGFADADFSDFDVERRHIGQCAAIMRAIRGAGCRELVLIGKVHRPAGWRLSDIGFSLLWPLLKNLDILWSGDAKLLSRIILVFEREGFKVRGAHEIAPQLLFPAGDHGRVSPAARDRRDIEIGMRAVHQIGALDIGQCVCVARGRVLAVEAAEGTDAMLERVAVLNRAPDGKRVGVAIKWPQLVQDLRVDMPTVGPQTVRLAAKAGLAGIVVAGEQVLAVDVDEMVSLADQHGMFLTALDPGAGSDAMS